MEADGRYDLLLFFDQGTKAPFERYVMINSRTVAVCLLAMTHHLASAQTTLTIADGSAASCLGILHDSGSTGGNGYSNNEDFTFTLCPDQPDVNLMLTFQSFDLDQSGDAGTWDNLGIFDGDDIDAPSLGTYTGTQLQNLTVSATVFNTTGCLTFRFRSNDIGTGVFAASFACVIPCYPPTAVAFMSPFSPARICAGEELQFDGSASFASPGNSIDAYHWRFGPVDAASGPIVSHVFDSPGYYPVTLTVIDDNACESMNSVELVVYVSTPPILSLSASDTVACVGSPIELNATLEPVPWAANNVNYGPGIFLPDDVGVPLTSDVTLTGFAPGATVTSTNDLTSLCVDMEHSFMGDLVLQVICPNGSELVLYQQGGGNTYVGAANDQDTSAEPVPGECWHYCWSPTATNGTWTDNSTIGSNNTQLAGTPPNAALNPGTYEAEGSWSNLIGCPLNGIWQFRATDLWAVDNGFLCVWEIHFDPALAGDTTAFVPSYGPGCDSTFWSGPDITAADPWCNTVVATPTTPGQEEYTYTAIDDFGCTFQSSITLNVLEATDPYCLTLGTESATMDPVSVYPVPVRDVLHVRHTEPINGYELIDLRGRQIMMGSTPTSGSLLLDLGGLPAGLYLLRLETASGPVPVRVVKE